MGECAPVAAAPVQQQMPQAPQQYGAPAANPVPSYGSAAPSYQQAHPPAAPQAAYGAGQQSGGYGATKPMPSSYGAAPNSRPVMKDDGAGATIMPINAINPYSSRYRTFYFIIAVVSDKFATFSGVFRWTIKARITSKSELRRWSNAKGEGTLFSIDLLDSDGGEIRATFFKEACEKFFPVLEEGKVSERGLFSFFIRFILFIYLLKREVKFAWMYNLNIFYYLNCAINDMIVQLPVYVGIYILWRYLEDGTE